MTFSCNTSADGNVAESISYAVGSGSVTDFSFSGLGFAECQVNLYLNNTNIEENTYLGAINTTTETTLSLTASEYIVASCYIIKIVVRLHRAHKIREKCIRIKKSPKSNQSYGSFEYEISDSTLCQSTKAT